ncbi:hypothetical protein [Paraburkholderia sp. RAU6.4a]|uniref:hypothetical protein n=1 Tax=Paraburkholderia sp. RAU6.4a TaxID=2991067 RepID=UPI003D1B380A
MLASIVGTASIYVMQFGTHLANQQETWAQFGDYFGGVLNPIFALLAFFGLLWSIQRQGVEFRASLEILQRQTRSSEEQVEMLRKERALTDLLQVIKEIDSRIEQILDIVISDPGSQRVDIRQMKSEAQRLRRSAGESPAYKQFLKVGNTQGSVVEAPVRELIHLVKTMREFLDGYWEVQPISRSSTLTYYADKCSSLMDMLEDLGGLPADTRAFFAEMSERSSAP